MRTEIACATIPYSCSHRIYKITIKRRMVGNRRRVIRAVNLSILEYKGNWAGLYSRLTGGTTFQLRLAAHCPLLRLLRHGFLCVLQNVDSLTMVPVYNWMRMVFEWSVDKLLPCAILTNWLDRGAHRLVGETILLGYHHANRFSRKRQ